MPHTRSRLPGPRQPGPGDSRSLQRRTAGPGLRAHRQRGTTGRDVPGPTRPRRRQGAPSEAPDHLGSGAGPCAGTSGPCGRHERADRLLVHPGLGAGPPAGAEALEWVLYTDQRTETLEEALVGVMDYGTRFLIEEFHKGLKTGLKAEELQLETGHRLFVFAAIAVMSVVALRLLDLRELGRAVPEAPARVT